MPLGEGQHRLEKGFTRFSEFLHNRSAGSES